MTPRMSLLSSFLLPISRISDINPFSAMVKVMTLPCGSVVTCALTSTNNPILKIALMSAVISSSFKGLPTLLLSCCLMASAPILRLPAMSIRAILSKSPMRSSIAVFSSPASASKPADPLPCMDTAGKLVSRAISIICASMFSASPNCVMLPVTT